MIDDSESRFAARLPIILQNEGGYVNNAADPGGATSRGITIGTLSSWLGRPATVADVRGLTVATVAPIYEANYWRAADCDGCPPGVDLMVFEMAVNQGVGHAIRSLQMALGLTADGVIGPQTRTAAANCDATKTIDAIAAMREAQYRSYATFSTFGAGWLSRLTRTTALAHKLAQ